MFPTSYTGVAPSYTLEMLSRRTALWTFAAVGLRAQNKMFGNAEAYELFMGRWSRFVAPRLVDFAELPDQGHILDIGSGTGSLAFSITDRHPAVQVTGIDPSKEYVEFATSRDRPASHTKFEVGDAQKMRFANATFDGAVSLLVFNFIPDPAKALSETRRVSKPGGHIAAAVWDYGDGMRMLRVFWDAVASIDPAAEKRDEKHMPLCHAGELAKLWKQAGLEQVQEKPLDVTTRFKSFADYWDPFLQGQGPAGAYVRTLAPDRVAALRKEVQRRLSAKSETEPITLQARVWAVRGSVPRKP